MIPSATSPEPQSRLPPGHRGNAATLASAAAPAPALHGLAGLVSLVPEIRLLTRFLPALLFVSAAIGGYLWTRLQVRETAIALDQVRSELVAESTLRDRLLVERTMLRSPARLGAVAVGMGLVAPARVVDVQPAPMPATGQP